jgi:hypothetical protein
MHKFIVTLDDKNVVVGVQQGLKNYVLNDNQQFVDTLDYDLLGKKLENNEFKTNLIQNVIVTRGEFKLRMTQSERIAVRSLAMQNAIAYDFMDLLQDLNDVPLNHPEVIAGIRYCSKLGAFTKARADEILGNS